MGSCLFFRLTACGEKMQEKTAVDGLDILVGTFHFDSRQGHFPGTQPVTGEGGEGNTTIPKEKNIAAICHIRLMREERLYSCKGNSPAFVRNHLITSFLIS